MVWLWVFLGVLGSTSVANATDLALVGSGSVWRYLDDGSDQGSAWYAPAFDDSAWASGPAELGYGDGDETTVVSFGPSSSNKFPTTYFRRSFAVADPGAVVRLTLRLRRDDGAVVYLNGNEVHRSNLPGGAVTYTTYATAAVAGADEANFFETLLDPAALVAGNNTLAVEVHQVNASSSDVSFDLELIASDVAFALTRGPYWQLATPTSLVVRWRTDVASDSRVRYGLALDALSETAYDASLTTEHSLTLSGLTPDTEYFFAVGATDVDAAGPDAAHVIRTSPLAGAAKATRVWVVGDAGTADGNQAAVRDAFVAYAGARPADLWLMLGDNAYDTGTDSEYQSAVFDMYADQLRTSPVWPTFGNHDAGSANSATQSGTYFDIFSLPTLAQAGGEPSGTEAYYSFDYGNIHFICLDSMGSSRLPGSAMLTWLEADLQATTAQWVIAYWHHPPYSKGSHDSDVESELVQMRQNVVPILETYGVDLVLAGHSHSYERSYLLDGHYGVSSTLQSSMLMDGGNGRVDGTGAYRKTGQALVPNEGAVYVVAGSSGRLDSVGNHPAMFAAWSELGSLILDVDGRRLDATFLAADGAVLDWFRIAKTTVACELTPRAGCRTAQRSSLSLRNRTVNDADTLAWSWLKGEATDLAEFGAPTQDTDYAVCLYADGLLTGEVDMPASPTTWSGARRSLKFKDRSGSTTGAKKAKLAAGAAARASIRLAAGGEALPDFPLPLTAPLTVQLVQGATTTCWEATYSLAQVTSNSPDGLKARAKVP